MKMFLTVPCILHRTDLGIFDPLKTWPLLLKIEHGVRQIFFTYISKTVKFSQILSISKVIPILSLQKSALDHFLVEFLHLKCEKLLFFLQFSANIHVLIIKINRKKCSNAEMIPVLMIRPTKVCGVQSCWTLP